MYAFKYLASGNAFENNCTLGWSDDKKYFFTQTYTPPLIDGRYREARGVYYCFEMAPTP